MSYLHNKLLLVLFVMATLLLLSCATTKPISSAKKSAKKSSTKTESDTAKQDDGESDNDSVDSQTDDKKKVEPQLDKALNIRKMSENETLERENRFDGTLYVGEGKKEFEKGLEFYFQTNCTQAISHWKNGLDDDKYAAPLAFNIALCLDREDKVADAEKWYKKSFNIDNNYTAPLYNLFLLKNRTKNANLSDFEKLALKIPSAVHRYNFLAWVYYQVKKYTYAEDNARKALKIDEQNSDAVVILASVYFKKGMFKLAQSALAIAEKWNESDFRLQRLYGFVLYKLGDVARATVHLQKAKQLNPELPGVLNLLAVLSFNIEDWDTAKQNLEFLLDFYPQFAPATLNLAIIHKQLKEYKKSNALLQQLEKRKDLSDEVRYKMYYNAAILHLDADVEQTGDVKRFDIAADYLQKALAVLKGKKGKRKQRKMLLAYVKESKFEKRKLQIQMKAKVKREKRRKERAEEDRKYQEKRKLHFAETEKSDTLEAWKLFVEKHPPNGADDEMAIKANTRLAALDSTMREKLAKEQAAKAAKQGAFDLAKKSDTAVLWSQFLKDFPPQGEQDDEMATMAKARVDFLQKRAAKRANEIELYNKDRQIAFEKTKKNNSLSAWRHFLQTFPPPSSEEDDQTSRFAKEQLIALQAQKEAEQQKEKGYRENRRRVFNVAKQQGSVAAWEDFRKTFPPYKGDDDTMAYYAAMQIETIKKQAAAKKETMKKQAAAKKESDYLNERAAAFNAVKQIDEIRVYEQFSRDFAPLHGKSDETSRSIEKRIKEIQKREKEKEEEIQRREKEKEKEIQQKKESAYLVERAKAFEVVKQIDELPVYGQFSKDFPPLNGKADKISRYVKKRMKQLLKKK